jgi:hypothetical protein
MRFFLLIPAPVLFFYPFQKRLILSGYFLEFFLRLTIKEALTE